MTKLPVSKKAVGRENRYFPIERPVVKRGGSKMIVVGKHTCEMYNIEEGDILIAQILGVVKNEA